MTANTSDSQQREFAVGISTASDWNSAIREAVESIESTISNPVDLAVVFSCQHRLDAEASMSPLIDGLSPIHLMGANSIGVIGGAKEFYSGDPTLVVWTASLPDLVLSSFHLTYEQSNDGGAFVGWPDDFENSAQDSVMMGIGDPYNFPMDLLLHRINEDRPGLEIVGGMASGIHRPGDSSLLNHHNWHSGGASFVTFQGSKRPRSMVSQGCRPVGDPMIITQCERNEIQKLGGYPAVEKLFEVYDQLPTRDQKRLNQGLHIGIALSEYKDQFGYGDFLIRNVSHIDRQTGAIQLADYVRVGQTVQFHIRDHETASLDLQQNLDSQSGPESDSSALLFSCNGRGPHLFPEPDHDSSLLAQRLGTRNIAGFFAAGEMGPVSGTNFLHGYTASALVF